MVHEFDIGGFESCKSPVSILNWNSFLKNVSFQFMMKSVKTALCTILISYHVYLNLPSIATVCVVVDFIISLYICCASNLCTLSISCM